MIRTPKYEWISIYIYMNTSKKNICLDKKTMCTEKVFYFYEIFVFIPKLGIVRQTVWLAISLFCYTISIMIFSSRYFTTSFATSGMIKVIIYPIFFYTKNYVQQESKCQNFAWYLCQTQRFNILLESKNKARKVLETVFFTLSKEESKLFCCF